MTGGDDAEGSLIHRPSLTTTAQCAKPRRTEGAAFIEVLSENPADLTFESPLEPRPAD